MKWTKVSHVGYGCEEGEPCSEPEFLEDVTLLDDQEAAEPLAATWETTLTSGSHFGDPKDGCNDDEDIVDLGLGHICSYKVSTVGNEPDGTPRANCSIGGAAPVDNNGCPTDAAVSSGSKAFPICLAKGGSDDPYTNGEFHCVLVCPCDYDDEGGCGQEAHTHCPGASTCQRGELRHRGQGVCTYSKSITSLTV